MGDTGSEHYRLNCEISSWVPGGRWTAVGQKWAESTKLGRWCTCDLSWSGIWPSLHKLTLQHCDLRPDLRSAQAPGPLPYFCGVACTLHLGSTGGISLWLPSVPVPQGRRGPFPPTTGFLHAAGPPGPPGGGGNSFGNEHTEYPCSLAPCRPQTARVLSLFLLREERALSPGLAKCCCDWGSFHLV